MEMPPLRPAWRRTRQLPGRNQLLVKEERIGELTREAVAHHGCPALKKMQYKVFTLASLFLLITACGTVKDSSDSLNRETRPDPGAQFEDSLKSTSIVHIELSAAFADVDGPGTFVLLNADGGRLYYNEERARKRFIPASTFKIPNSLIALEAGVASGPDFMLSRDSTAVPKQPWWPKSWDRDQTLRSAFRNSVPWFYQELARRIGAGKMRSYLHQLKYGNRKTSPAIDRFWLDGDLRISPIEQVEFLHRFYFEKLGVSRRSTTIVKEIMVLEEIPGYRLSGKTGTAEITKTRELGWLVGYLERGEKVDFFAINMEGELVWERWPPPKRIELCKKLLRQVGALPALATDVPGVR